MRMMHRERCRRMKRMRRGVRMERSAVGQETEESWKT